MSAAQVRMSRHGVDENIEHSCGWSTWDRSMTFDEWCAWTNRQTFIDRGGGLVRADQVDEENCD